MMFSVTIWMGMGERDLLGSDLDGIGNSDLSRFITVTYRLPITVVLQW